MTAAVTYEIELVLRSAKRDEEARHTVLAGSVNSRTSSLKGQALTAMNRIIRIITAYQRVVD